MITYPCECTPSMNIRHCKENLVNNKKKMANKLAILIIDKKKIEDDYVDGYLLVFLKEEFHVHALDWL